MESVHGEQKLHVADFRCTLNLPPDKFKIAPPGQSTLDCLATYPSPRPEMCQPLNKSGWIKIADDRQAMDVYPADSCAISPAAFLFWLQATCLEIRFT